MKFLKEGDSVKVVIYSGSGNFTLGKMYKIASVDRYDEYTPYKLYDNDGRLHWVNISEFEELPQTRDLTINVKLKDLEGYLQGYKDAGGNLEATITLTFQGE